MSKKPEPAAKPDKAKEAKDAKAKAKDKPEPKPPKAPKGQRRRVPLLQETAFTVTKLTLLTTGPLIVGLSLQAGATLLMAAVRAGAAVLVVGLLLWGANWVLARSALEVMHMQLKEAAEQHAPSATIELEA